MPLAEALLEKGLTLLVENLKPDIPAVMKTSKSRVHSTKFGKAVILLSAMHHDKSVDDESQKKKTDVIKYYNGCVRDLSCGTRHFLLAAAGASAAIDSSAQPSLTLTEQSSYSKAGKNAACSCHLLCLQHQAPT
ncbi:hypothetical protein EOD39_10934 [Acipenser ruthenus]|uniref:Uncharacterized protein n=1 Tax=Acipenser ruthenus TaxID=7906 RepID=A0A662YVX0_ACIRT|nr:hypothetical protein EOD39_10934 [Acipenser ruthenus]